MGQYVFAASPQAILVVMKKILQVFFILTLGIATLIVAVSAGDAQLIEGRRMRLSPFPALSLQSVSTDFSPGLSSACATKPVPKANKSRKPIPAALADPPLSRFRQEPSLVNPSKDSLDKAVPTYSPREEVAIAHPTNFGRRFMQDLSGRSVNNDAIVVLHETVGSAQSTINYFQTPHPNDDDQVSYHTLIKDDGTIVYLVPPDRRAFGAGNSLFVSNNSSEAVQTNPDFPPSVNNFAYHISLVTPPDGRDNASRHSGYTRAQYQSLAWLVAKTGIPDSRITTHKGVDRSRQRQDPRSFEGEYFLRLLSFYPRTQEISTQCSMPAVEEE
jgi:N-acetylmuramoyl-L-alanine amidase